MRIFDEVSRFTVGTVGMPGERTFFLQIRSDISLISLSLEKSQVAAMSERLSYMLKEIRTIHPLAPLGKVTRDSLPLEIPVLDECRIGSIAIFYDENRERIQIDLREMSNSEFEFEDPNDSDDSVEESGPLGNIQVFRIFITTAQAQIFVDRAELVIAAGRQPCPFCSFPIDPQGHLCARANGYRR